MQKPKKYSSYSLPSAPVISLLYQGLRRNESRASWELVGVAKLSWESGLRARQDHGERQGRARGGASLSPENPPRGRCRGGLGTSILPGCWAQGFRQKVEISVRSCHLPPSPHSLPPFLPSSLLCSLLPFPVPSSLLCELPSLAAPFTLFTSSPAPIPKNGVGVSRATKLSSQHLYPSWLLLNWSQLTKEGGGKPDPPKTSLQLHQDLHSKGGFCILGAGQICPGLNSLSSLRSWHTQVSRCQLRAPRSCKLVRAAA